MYNVIIAGAGFAGCVCARRLAEGGKKVLVLEARADVGGNAYDYFTKCGLLVHRYGPHIFHTNSKVVFDFLSRFTSWNGYCHRVAAYVGGQLIPLPFNYH